MSQERKTSKPCLPRAQQPGVRRERRGRVIVTEQAYRRLPTGNFCLNLLRCHSTSLCVVKTIAVHSKSNAESASEAMSDSEEE